MQFGVAKATLLNKNDEKEVPLNKNDEKEIPLKADEAVAVHSGGGGSSNDVAASTGPETQKSSTSPLVEDQRTPQQQAEEEIAEDQMDFDRATESLNTTEVEVTAAWERVHVAKAAKEANDCAATKATLREAERSVVEAKNLRAGFVEWKGKAQFRLLRRKRQLRHLLDPTSSL